MFFKKIDFGNINELAKYGLYWQTPPSDDWEFNNIVLFGRNYKKNDIVLVDSNKSYIGRPISSLKNIKEDVCLLVKEGVPLDTNLPILRAKRLNNLIDIIMRYKRDNYLGKVISVTGSVGKTSTTAIISDSLCLFAPVLVSIRDNLRNGIYQKLNIIKNEPFAVFEVSAGGLRTVTEVLQSNVAVLLNVGEAHLEHYSTLENLAKHKAKVFEGCPPDGVGVLYTDLPYFDIILDIAKNHGRNIITYGKSKSADILFLSFNQGCLDFKYKEEIYSVKLNTKDECQALNFLASISVLVALDLPWKEKLVQLSSCIKVIEGRGDEHNAIINGKFIKIIDSAFNSSPLALTSVLKSFDARDDLIGRKIVVLSDMLELGSMKLFFHQNLIDCLDAYKNIDMFLLVGNTMGSVTLKSSLDKKTHQYHELEEAFKFLESQLQPSDTVLFKGSNGTGLRKKLWETFKVCC